MEALLYDLVQQTDLELVKPHSTRSLTWVKTAAKHPGVGEALIAIVLEDANLNMTVTVGDAPSRLGYGITDTLVKIRQSGDTTGCT